MKLVKILGGLLIVVVIVVAAGVYYVYNNTDSLVKRAIEQYGSEATGTAVNVDGVHIDWQAGKIELTNLTVANPAGYSTPNALAVGTALVDVNYDSIREKIIIIDNILVDQAHVTAEEKNMSQINLKELSERLAQPESGGSGGTQGDSPSSDIKLALKQFTFSKAQLSLVSSRYGDRDDTLPTITASNVGVPNGLAPEALAKALLDQVLDKAIRQSKARLKDEAEDKLKEKAREKLEEKLSDKDKEKLDKLKSLFK